MNNELDSYLLDDFPEEYKKEYIDKLNKMLSSNEKKINSYVNTNINSGKVLDSAKVTSNLEYVKNHISNIMSKTRNSIDFTTRRHSVNSEKDNNMLYSKINNVMSSYYDIQTKLMDKINNELKFIELVAESYEELDKDLSSKAGDL